jgi:hypothetical protein
MRTGPASGQELPDEEAFDTVPTTIPVEGIGACPGPGGVLVSGIENRVLACGACRIAAIGLFKRRGSESPEANGRRGRRTATVGSG